MRKIFKKEYIKFSSEMKFNKKLGYCFKILVSIIKMYYFNKNLLQ